MPAWNRQRRGAALEVCAVWCGSIVVAELEGRLTAESDAHQFMRLVTWVVQHGGTDVVLDLQHVRQLDCTGLGLLVLARNRLAQHGCPMALANVERRQRRLLDLAGLLTVLPVFGSRQDAVAWCRRAREQECRSPRIPAGWLVEAPGQWGYLFDGA